MIFREEKRQFKFSYGRGDGDANGGKRYGERAVSLPRVVVERLATGSMKSSESIMCGYAYRLIEGLVLRLHCQQLLN